MRGLRGYSRAMKGRRVPHAEAALLVVSAVASPRAAAAAEREGDVPVLVDWEAPRGCPDREAIVRRLSDALADAPAGLGTGWQVRGRINAGREGWVLVLQLRAPSAAEVALPAERVLSARDCNDLGEAAAVAVAIALDDASNEREVAPNGGVASEAPPEATSSQEASPAVPAARGQADPVTDRAEDVALAPTAAGEPVRLALAADGVLDSASLGGLAWGASLELSGWWRRFGAGAYGLWLAPRATQLGTGQQAEFSLLGGGLRACYRAPADWLWVSPCVGLELGRFAAESDGLRAGRDVHDTWLAGSVGVALGSRLLDALGLHSRVELVLPTGRQEYLVDEQVVHRVPAATLRWLVGIDSGGS